MKTQGPILVCIHLQGHRRLSSAAPEGSSTPAAGGTACMVVGAHAHVCSFDPGQLPPLTLRTASWHPLPAGPPVAAASTSCRCSPLTASTTIAGRPSAACSRPPANSSDSILLSPNLVSVKTDVHLVMKNTDFTWRVHMIRYVIYHYAKCRADNRQILNIAHKQSPGWPHTVVPRLILQRRERRVH